MLGARLYFAIVSSDSVNQLLWRFVKAPPGAGRGGLWSGPQGDSHHGSPESDHLPWMTLLAQPLCPSPPQPSITASCTPYSQLTLSFREFALSFIENFRLHFSNTCIYLCVLFAMLCGKHKVYRMAYKLDILLPTKQQLVNNHNKCWWSGSAAWAFPVPGCKVFHFT